MAANTRVCVIIKALNEQANIERAIRSALAAVEGVGGEVILADSLSTDATVAIASKFPIKIVQLTDPGDRSCGVGAQLGYQHSTAEFVYILDGDMTLSGEFVRAALALMDDEPDVAGVGGIVKEMNIEGLEFQGRVQRAPADMQPGEVDRLNMGGLYRRSALDQAGGYLTNRNLHACEEFELAIRLRSCGWRLKRLPIQAIEHYGHTLLAYTLLRKRWASGYAHGPGELIRALWGNRKQMALLFKDMRELRLYAMVAVWWAVLLAIPWTAFTLPVKLAWFIAILLLPLVGMLVKKRNLSMALYSVVSWQYLTAGMLVGMAKGQGSNPAAPVNSKPVATTLQPD
ncbi:MAG: glycosyltransferase [Candidatus Methylumidiphilus sp.]